MIFGNTRRIKSAKIKFMQTNSSALQPEENIAVLIVEDNEEHANLFSLYLERSQTHKFSVTKTARLAAAIEEIAENSYDVILLDLTLPESQGLNTFYQLHTRSDNIPIVVLSGLDDELAAIEAVRGGAQDYLVKGHADQQLIIRSIRYALERKKSAEDLRLSEERFRSMIENSSDLIALIDREKRYSYVSPSYEKIIGYAPENLLGRQIIELLHPDETEIVLEMILLALESKNFQTNLDFKLRDNGGSWKIFSGSISSFRNGGGERQVAINCHEITERVQKEKELALAYEATLEGWSRALELRSKETEGHSQRVTEMTLKLAREAGMKTEELLHVRRGTLLHDIGKMAIPDHILMKPTELTEEEREVIKQHTTFAYEMLHPIEYLRPALDIPVYHHERWDGSGYPEQLKGTEIPMAARIFAVIDVWDALTAERPYRGAWSEEKAKEYIKNQAGKHFDPEIVDIFLKIF
jgi:PAS domain S-box-containing protein/putative nucleotidyltransferase with HDIG domain